MKNIIRIEFVEYVEGAMNQVHLENVKLFKAFCDETRLMVLELLQSGEKCACVLLEKVVVGQSTLSHHMKILVESGIVNARKEGKWMYYSISAEGSENAARLLKELTTVTIDENDNWNAGCQDE
jgi:ArsR family transcriptional regulator